MSLSRLALLAPIFVIAAGCASVHDSNHVSSNGQETIFLGPSNILFSIPDDRPNACPKEVNMHSFFRDAQKQGLQFTRCDVACFSLSGEVVRKLGDGRIFGRCFIEPDRPTNPNSSWGFAAILVKDDQPSAAFRVAHAKFVTGPKGRAPDFILAR